MSRILLVGNGPLMEENARNFSGLCLRTWFFAKPLIDDGHTLTLVTIPIFDASDPRMYKQALHKRSIEGLDYYSFQGCEPTHIQFMLPRLIERHRAQALVGVNIDPARHLARIASPLPLWADLNGYEMTEKQGQCARSASDAALGPAWASESGILRRADKISAVSRAQLAAIEGELAAVGRLNRHTLDYPFAHHIPNASHPAFAAPPDPAAPPLLRGKRLPRDAFILLSSGGYNYWLDPQLLFDFLQATLDAEPRAHFVSTGGAIDGYDNATYERFQQLVAQSPHRDRFHLLGWVPAAELPRYYHEADLGLSIDELNHETRFGARNRINNFMAAGLPVLATAGSEIADELEREACGLVCPPGDAQALARAAIEMARDPGALATLARRAREHASQAFDPARLTAPLRDWAKHPASAPDNQHKRRSRPGIADLREAPTNQLDAETAALEWAGLDEMLEARRALRRFRAGWAYRLLRGIARGGLA